MRRYPYTDEKLIEASTRPWLDRGVSILQAHMHGGSERSHVEWLLEQLRPEQGDSVLDIASGVGGVADHASILRPDLEWTLLNISQWQMQQCSPIHNRVVGDMEALPFADGSFDCALICYALGHGDAIKIIREAERVAFRVLVFDVAARDYKAWKKELHYVVPDLRLLAYFGPIELIRHSDGGRFEPLLPGFWKRTGAVEFFLEVEGGV